MNHQLFLLLHLVSVLLLTGVIFATFASPDPERRRSVLMRSGSLSLLVFLSGFGVMGMLGLGFPGWALVKVLCWLVLSALPGLAFRMTGVQRRVLAIVAVGVIVLAVAMVAYRPF